MVGGQGGSGLESMKDTFYPLSGWEEPVKAKDSMKLFVVKQIYPEGESTITLTSLVKAAYADQQGYDCVSFHDNDTMTHFYTHVLSVEPAEESRDES